MTRIQRTAPSGSATTAAISAAQNETEGFQIIVRAPGDDGLIGVNAHATDLVGPQAVVNASNIRLYREHYVRVTTSSPGSPYTPGEWPDALVPFIHPETGQPLSGGRFPAAPFDVDARKNQPVYVEVQVPAGTPAGVYRGAIVLTATGHNDTEVPISVLVRRFALPQQPTLRSTFTPYSETWKAARYFGSTSQSEYLAVADRFNNALLDHRLSPNTPDGSSPYIDRSTGHITTTYSHATLKRYLDDPRTTGWAIPFDPTWPWSDPAGADRDKAITYLREMADYLSANGWFEKSYVYLFDEPRNQQAYATIRDVADLIHSVRAEYRILVTEQTRPEEQSWGNLDGAVNIWVPLFSTFDEPSASIALARGDEIWSYTEGAAAPAWLIDQPLLNSRVPAWVNWRFGQTGLLYWTPWYWEETNPWDNPGNYTIYSGTYNGNGCLVYPGNDVGYARGPIPSMRLKALRDGIEDYDYLKVLSDLGESSAADGEALEIGTSWTAWNTDPRALQDARERLADRIDTIIAGRN